MKISLTEIVKFYYAIKEKAPAAEQRLGQMFCNFCIEDPQPELFYNEDPKETFIMICNYIEDRGLDKENLDVLNLDYYKQIDDLVTRESN